jgi:hypothetical protein
MIRTKNSKTDFVLVTGNAVHWSHDKGYIFMKHHSHFFFQRA